MKAIVYTEYGSADVLHYTEVPKPVPAHDEVLIKIRAAALNALDWRMMNGKPVLMRPMIGGLRKPRVTRPGLDVSGQVEAVGKTVTQFKPGDDVFGACRGSCAEYGCAKEDKLAPKPAGVSFEDAAAVPVAGLTALQGLRDRGRVQRGHRVLVDGASGGVGTYAIQVAKAFGAEVTASCSTNKMETARSIGADHVIDYTRDDFAQKGKLYDVIIGANAHHSLYDYRRALSPNGIYVLAGGGVPQMLQALLLGPLVSKVGKKKLGSIMARVKRTDLDYLATLLAAGTIVSVIDRRYPLHDTANAVRYLEEGHANGKVVITVGTE
jgi:NADPH:quinone reductase-like Zn-dependent oxidoreductase